MFDIGLTELLLIVVAAIVFVGPKDLPVVVRAVAKCLRELRAFYLGAKHQAMKLADEVGLNDLHQEMTTIIDLEGKPQQAYDVRKLASIRMNSARDAGSASPLAGEATRLSDPLGALSRSGEGASSEADDRDAPSPKPSPAGGEGSPAAPLSLNNPLYPRGQLKHD